MSSDNRNAGFSLNGSPSPATDHQQYKMNGKIIIGSVAVLFIIVFTILGLHLYAKWFWRRANRRQALLRRRNAVNLQDQEPLTTGLDKAVVESLPTFIYKVSPGQKDVLECAVCLSEFQEDEKGRLLPKCNHRFHTSCIDMWFLSNTTCPLCRLSAEPTVSHPSEESQDATSLPLLVPQDRLDGRDGGSQSDSGEERPDVSGEPSRNSVGSLLRRQFSFQSPGGRSWRRSISDRFPQISQGVQFPTNVLFWGNHSHVNSRVNAEHWQIGGRSLPHIVIEVPRGQDSSLAPQVTSISPSHCCPFEDQSCSSPSMQRPFNRFNSLKRLLSREKRLASSDQASNSCGAQGGSGL